MLKSFADFLMTVLLRVLRKNPICQEIELIFEQIGSQWLVPRQDNHELNVML